MAGASGHEIRFQCVHRSLPSVRLIAEEWPVGIAGGNLAEVRPAKRAGERSPEVRRTTEPHSGEGLPMIGAGKRNDFCAASNTHSEFDCRLVGLPSTGAEEGLGQTLGSDGSQLLAQLDDRHAAMQYVGRREFRHLPGNCLRNYRIRMTNHRRTGRTGHGVEIDLSIDIPHPRAFGPFEDQRTFAPESIEDVFLRQRFVVHLFFLTYA